MIAVEFNLIASQSGKQLFKSLPSSLLEIFFFREGLPSLNFRVSYQLRHSLSDTHFVLHSLSLSCTRGNKTWLLCMNCFLHCWCQQELKQLNRREKEQTQAMLLCGSRALEGWETICLSRLRFSPTLTGKPTRVPGYLQWSSRQNCIFLSALESMGL